MNRDSPRPLASLGLAIVLAASAWLVGGACAMESVAPPPPPPPPPMESARYDLERIPVRAVQVRGEAVEAGFGAYGYLLLPHAPTAAERPRYLRVCEEFVRLTPSRDEVATEPAESLMVTHWLVKRAVDEDDCEELVAEYDHVTAARIARSVGRAR